MSWGALWPVGRDTGKTQNTSARLLHWHPPGSIVSLSLYPWKQHLRTNRCLKPLRQVHEAGAVSTTPVLDRLPILWPVVVEPASLPHPALLAWWVRDQALGTFSWPPTPGNIGFAGGEKQFVAAVSTPMVQRLEIRKKTEQHIFPSKSCMQKRKNKYLFCNLWEVEIKNRLSINEFMVSEAPLSPRKT